MYTYVYVYIYTHMQDYIEQVAQAGISVWVAVHVYDNGREDCGLFDAVFKARFRKRALHFRKRAQHLYRRALYLCKRGPIQMYTSCTALYFRKRALYHYKRALYLCKKAPV